jgi:hypothetical protein
MAVVAVGFGNPDHRSMLRGNSTVVSRIAQIVDQFRGAGSADGTLGGNCTFSVCETENNGSVPGECDASHDSARTVMMAASGVYNPPRQNEEAPASPTGTVEASQPPCHGISNHSTCIGLPPRYQVHSLADNILHEQGTDLRGTS